MITFSLKTISFLNKFVNSITLLLLTICTFNVHADVVKPALIEIIVDEQGNAEIEIRASIEALLTGINSKYKNTQDSPNAEAYDVLRKMPKEALMNEFNAFKEKFLTEIKLLNEFKKEIPLTITNTKIPEPGYTKVPRISIITLAGKVDVSNQSISWYYPMAFGDNAVRVKQVNASEQDFHWSEWQWLKNDKASEAFSLTEIVTQKSLMKTIVSYVVLGFEHIIPKGLDHILFILGLFLFSVSLAPLLWQVTMFTVAHSITLGLAMYGLINLPANIVEPLIALSIAYVGLENVFAKGLNKSRLLLVFLFGLLHGLGFAGVLSEFDLPKEDFIKALISFNVGVELGQLFVIFVCFVLVGYWFGKKPWYKKYLTNPASIVISLVAFYWFIERLDLNFFQQA